MCRSTQPRIPGPSLRKKKIESARNESWIAAAASDAIPLMSPWISVGWAWLVARPDAVGRAPGPVLREAEIGGASSAPSGPLRSPAP